MRRNKFKEEQIVSVLKDLHALAEGQVAASILAPMFEQGNYWLALMDPQLQGNTP